MNKIFRSPKTTREKREGIASAISNRDRARANNLSTNYDDIYNDAVKNPRGDKPWWRKKRKEQKKYREKIKREMETALKEEQCPPPNRRREEDTWDCSLWENQTWEDLSWEDPLDEFLQEESVFIIPSWW